MKSLQVIVLSLPLFLAAVFLETPAFCQQVEMGLQEINQKSDVILQVQVKSNESKWVSGTGGKNIVTSTVFKVTDCIKGDFNTNNLLTINMLGGKVGDTTQFVSSSVNFFPGEESILFLPKNPDYITGGFQGKVSYC
jgi:hypothetical protein